MEVLISIGIMAIGMISIASLLPVGGIYVQRANVEERKSELGQNAYREFQIRGMGKIDNWVRADGTAYTATGLSPQVQKTYAAPIAIDPMMMARTLKDTNSFDPNAQKQLQYFPMWTNPSGQAPAVYMRRLTLPGMLSTTNGSAISKAIAESVFTLTDDLVITQPEDRSLPATNPTSTEIAEAASHRPYVGDYTWMATLTPHFASSTGPAPMDQMLLSIVIFASRTLPPSPTGSSAFNPALVHEAFVNAGIDSGGSLTQPTAGTVNIGGGDLLLQDPSAQADTNLAYARPGTWMMLCRWNTTTSERIFKWYRIISAAEGSTPDKLNITLNGPDWVWGNPNPPGGGDEKTYACLFDGAVAVYQRVIHLDGPSVWNQ